MTLTRVHLERYVRWMQETRRYQPLYRLRGLGDDGFPLDRFMDDTSSLPAPPSPRARVK
jgi:hypothetical protein